jgi:DNA-binding SARP family transcriptional activator/tetratricopeptide (TPR) repeat protein
MARPILRLFGAFQLELEPGKAVFFPTKKTKALLAYLAYHDKQPHERAKLAALLWADSAETQARESLRQTLSLLRRVFSGIQPDPLLTHGDTVALESAVFSIDTVQFEQLANGEPADLDRAVQLYRGEFLDGFDLRAPEFETWLLSVRQQLNAKVIKTLNRLLAHNMGAGDVERSISTATRILSLDPLQESAHRSLMELYGRQRRYADALRQYRICSDVLAQELGVEPEAATTMLYRQIREQRNRRRAAETDVERRKLQVQTPSNEGAQPGIRPMFEERQITIMACDLFRVDALSSRLDPEDLQPVLGAYKNTCVDIVFNFGGLVRKFSGDGMTVYFGYPEANEHSAEQAVRAALALLDAIPRMDTAIAQQAPVRIGIATGPVFIGDLPEDPDMTEALVGEAPKLATLLQSLARPGSVVIAAATRELVHDLFEYVPLSAVGSLGLAPAWYVVGERENASRFDARYKSRTTKFVGRERELELLLNLWRSTKACSEWVELIEGEAGIGKSRLVRAFQERISVEPHHWLSFQCSPFHANSPLYPLGRHIELVAGLSTRDTPEQKLEKLEIMLAKMESTSQDAVLFLAALLSIPVNDRYRPLTLNPAQLRRKILATLLNQVENLALRSPVIMMFEDAHWADASTLEFLALLVERIRQLPVLVLVTYRPGLDVSWSSLDHVGTLSLGRLDDENVRCIIHEVSRDRYLSSEIVTEIVRKTDGIPLFVEELVNTVLESGAAVVGAEPNKSDVPLRRPTIPASLRDSLMARLDQLASAKEIAQAGAVIGREFSGKLLASVAGIPRQQLEEDLLRLAESGLINAGGSSTERSYIFRHALLQDAAYETIPKSRRQKLHAAVARALLNADPDVAEIQPEVLAYHYTEARVTADALRFWLKAGKFSAGRSAHKEAIAHFERGLGFLKSVPLAGQERARWELLFLTAMSPSVMAIHGFGAIESQDVVQRAHDLLDDSTPLLDRLQVLGGLWNIRFHRGEPAAALQIGRQYLELAQASKFHLDLANNIVGQTLAMMGEFTAALHHIQQVVDNHRPGKGDSTGHLFLVDNHVVAFTYMSRVLWALGFPVRAIDAAQEAARLAQETAHSPSVATALIGRLFMAVHSAPLERAVTRAREAIAYCEEHELILYQRWARFLCGALLVHEGDISVGIEMMESSVSAAEASQHRIFRPFQLACIGAAYTRLGNSERGLKLLDTAISTAEASGEKQSLATIHRLRGETLSGLAQNREAEHSFASALSVARGQEHRIEELRVAIAMVRHSMMSDDAEHGRKALKDIYSTFEEGHEFPDLRTARNLLSAHHAPAARPSDDFST